VGGGGGEERGGGVLVFFFFFFFFAGMLVLHFAFAVAFARIIYGLGIRAEEKFFVCCELRTVCRGIHGKGFFIRTMSFQQHHG